MTELIHEVLSEILPIPSQMICAFFEGCRLFHWFNSITGDYQDAARHFEAYYSLASQNKDWVTADDITYHTDSCINLSRIYTTLGEMAENESLEMMLDLLTKAYNMARECK